MTDSLDELIKKTKEFAKNRDWEQFHSPKNLSMALVVETSELMEIFQWLTPAESERLTRSQLAKVRDEIGDVMIYLVRLADRLSISPVSAAHEKLHKNEAKYPAERARGSAKKYTEL